MIDLSTTYLGLSLKNPLVASASPLCEDVDNIRRMEDAGAAAVVLHSLFEEQITLESNHLDRYLSQGTESFAESLSYFPAMANYRLGPNEYLEHIRRTKAAVRIPVIGSLNGVSTGGWIRYAKMIQEAGADALELNVYYIATDPEMTSAQVEQMYLDLVRDVKGTLKIPVAVKLGHAFTAMANMARRLDQAGADALVLFNRFYQPDFDLEKLEAVPHLTLSNSYELLLRIHWVAILYGRIRADLAVTGGVHTAQDVLKAMMSRGAGGDDDLGPAQERDRVPGQGTHRPAGLDGRARVRLHPPDAGQHELPLRGRAGRLRARQLHEGAELVRPEVLDSPVTEGPASPGPSVALRPPSRPGSGPLRRAPHDTWKKPRSIACRGATFEYLRAPHPAATSA